jgi:predicted DCC family thiol-disulfide oxidoreductase YuxK
MTTGTGAHQPANGWILYDSDCGVCSRIALKFRAVFARLGLAIAPLQSSWVEKRTGLPQDVLLTDLRLLHCDGRLTSGADVYRYVMRRLWWAYPLYIVSVLPGLDRVFDSSYRSFARNRKRISASCGLPPQSSAEGTTPITP